MTGEPQVAGTEPSNLVIDASVIIKWHVEESHAAESLRHLDDRSLTLHVPDLAFPEVGNVVWKKVRRREINPSRAREIIALMGIAPLVVHPSAPLLEGAFLIASDTGRTVYDSLYVALAAQLGTRLITADEKLFNSLHAGSFAHLVDWIGNG